MEANNKVFQATPHRCDAPTNGHYNGCDRGGCDESTRDSPNAYGPGSSFTINTELPFEVRTEFFRLSGTFVRMKTALLQGPRAVVLNHENCQPEYLAQLTDPLAAGMSLRITYWGDAAETMSWMDMPPCGGESCSASAGNALISNITVRPLPGEADTSAFEEVVVRRFEDPSVVSSSGAVMRPGEASPLATGATLFPVTVALGLAALAMTAVRMRRTRLPGKAPRGVASAPGRYAFLEPSGSLSPPPQSPRGGSGFGAADVNGVPDSSAVDKLLEDASPVRRRTSTSVGAL